MSKTANWLSQVMQRLVGRFGGQCKQGDEDVQCVNEVSLVGLRLEWGLIRDKEGNAG